MDTKQDGKFVAFQLPQELELMTVGWVRNTLMPAANPDQAAGCLMVAMGLILACSRWTDAERQHFIDNTPTMLGVVYQQVKQRVQIRPDDEKPKAPVDPKALN
jgi:hypothetical protein